MVRRFEQPPQRATDTTEWEHVDYAPGSREGGFIFPPPQRMDPGDTYEVVRQVGESLGQVKDDAEWAAEETRNQGQVLEDYGDALEQKVEPWAVPTVAPLSQSINRRADPSFQLQGFLALYGSVDGDPVGRLLAGGHLTRNRRYFTFITPAINRAYTQVSFMVGEAQGFPAARLDIAVYVMDADRQLSRQLLVEDVPGIGSGEQLVTVDFDEPWIATQGSYIAVAIRQLSNDNLRPILGVLDTPRPLSGAVMPPRITAVGGTGVLNETFDGTTQLDFEHDDAWFVPYIELSEDVGPDLRIHVDNFTSSGWLTRPWVPLTSQGPYAGSGSVGVIRNIQTGFPAGPRIALFDSPMGTDHITVRVQMGTVAAGGSSWFAVRATNNLHQGVGIFVSTSEVTLRTWNVSDVHNIGSSSVVVATISTGVSEGQTIEVDYADGAVSLAIGGELYLDGEYVEAPWGPAGRFLGIGFEKANAGNVYPPRFSSWGARDVAVNGDEEDDIDEDEEP